MIGHAFIPVGFGGNDIFPLGRLPIQKAGRTEGDEMGSACLPVDLNEIGGGECRADFGKIESDLHAA